MPGSSASRIRVMAASHTAIAIFMHAISSADLMARARSIGALASARTIPRRASAAAPSGSVRSIAIRGAAPPAA